MPASSAGLTVLDTVLLKVASRCNLDCSYCYVYHMGDDGWRRQPKRMDMATIARVAEQLGEVYRSQVTPFSVVLHGGEPLLLGVDRLEALLSALRTELPHPCGLHVQTNGLLLDDIMIDLLVAYDVGISVSIDGPAEIHDQFRKDHRGRGSHVRVVDAIKRVVTRADAAPLLAGVLAVVDPRSDPRAVYEALKSLGAPGVDVLVRDGNWDALPFGKASASSTEYGAWLAALLDVYLADRDPPRIRLLDDLLRLLLGGRSQKEGVGSTDYGILVIEPDGRIDKNDTLKVAYPEADRFGTSWNVHETHIRDILQSDMFAAYHRQQRPSAAACQTCPELAVCGGGMVAHRWSAERGFDNPTIFCADQKHLIGAMRATLARRSIVPAEKERA
jgi:uncharacterized protein